MENETWKTCERSNRGKRAKGVARDRKGLSGGNREVSKTLFSGETRSFFRIGKVRGKHPES